MRFAAQKHILRWNNNLPISLLKNNGKTLKRTLVGTIGQTNRS
jgi:hypothetical protein